MQSELPPPPLLLTPPKSNFCPHTGTLFQLINMRQLETEFRGPQSRQRKTGMESQGGRCRLPSPQTVRILTFHTVKWMAVLRDPSQLNYGCTAP